MPGRRAADLDLTPPGPVSASPSAWEDEVLYFLLVDRFSDGQEDQYLDLDGNPVPGATPRYTAADEGSAVQNDADAARWRAAGTGWVGGTLTGVRSKLGYLRRMGVTALWISPVLKQAWTPPGGTANYHGYATQDFLTVEPRFGTNDDFRDLVRAAHDAGLRVILDVVLNHAGDVFAYDLSDPTRYPSTDPDDPPGTVVPRWDGRPYPVEGWRDGAGGIRPFNPQEAAALWPDGAVFPEELHPPGTWSRLGQISNWDHDPEYLEGDFSGLKDIAQAGGPPDQYTAPPALAALTRAYCWWIAYADLDGFRVDTVKHMDVGATRYFASAVHEFAESIGKDRFFLVGEITGGRDFAVETMECTGLDAALGLADLQGKLEDAATGAGDPAAYFDLFRNSELIGKGSHTWLRNTVVTSYDDHDQVRKGNRKARLCADPQKGPLALCVLALNVLTLGIPCIYYGSEQLLDGRGDGRHADRYIREAMFGGGFGVFRSRGRHVFDEDQPVHGQLAALLQVRREEPALRRGRQYLREISGNGTDFGPPTGSGGPVRSVVAWSRLLGEGEVLCAVNTDAAAARTAWVTVDAGLHPAGSTLGCRYGSDPGVPANLPVVSTAGRSAVQLTLPPAAVAVFR
jgi:glycosidase